LGRRRLARGTRAIEPARERTDPDERVIAERIAEVREALGRLEADVSRGRLP
jgi:hypothetical protein